MIEMPAGLLRSFRRLARKSLLAGGPRAPLPASLCLARAEGLTLCCSQGDFALQHVSPGSYRLHRVAVPGALLAELEGRGAVSLEQLAPFRARATWRDGDTPCTKEFDTADPSTLAAPLALPRGSVAMPQGFLIALAEAARTASREAGAAALRQPGRGVLRRVLLRGSDGRVVASDGRQLLLQAGFSFPWKDDVLVPALPAFAGRELMGQSDVRLGRRGKRLLLQAGPWLLQVPAEGARGYPDVGRVIPPAQGEATRLRLDAEDVSSLLEKLPGLPGHDEEHAPVTLALGATIAVRGHAGKGPAQEARLPRSRAIGPAVQVAMDRRYLLRALRLGFRELLVISSERPLVCRDDRRTYAWMPLDSAQVARAARTARPTPDDQDSQREATVPTHDTSNGQPVQQAAEADALAEAEALRLQLQEALARTARLVAALRQQKRQGRAVQAAVASLRKLQQLGG